MGFLCYRKGGGGFPRFRFKIGAKIHSFRCRESREIPFSVPINSIGSLIWSQAEVNISTSDQQIYHLFSSFENLTLNLVSNIFNFAIVGYATNIAFLFVNNCFEESSWIDWRHWKSINGMELVHKSGKKSKKEHIIHK